MIRVATMDDMDRLLVMGELMHKFGHYENLDFDPRRLYLAFRCHILPDDRLCVVFENNPAVEGFVCASVDPWYGGNDRVASETALFSTISGQGIGRSLIQCYIAWAQYKQAKKINFGVTVGIEDQKVDGLLGQLGFAATGKHYVFKQ